ncbi:MAG: hypothetical protein KDD33_12495 [Bdellovibrionales bacterium]|nr:hypothetical protein [Bdellovibrionales bacterium]
MRVVLILAHFLLILSACNSPMNHRVEADSPTNKSLESMSFSSYSLAVEVQWLTGPVGNIQTKNQLLVILKNDQGAPSPLPEGLTLNFYATMPSMGHPMDDAGQFQYLGNGIYLNPSIKYNMPGDWKNELWIMDNQFNIKDKVTWEEFF